MARMTQGWRRVGKSQAFRDWLMAWWRLWERGYRGPMPYVIGPGWKPRRRPVQVQYDD